MPEARRLLARVGAGAHTLDAYRRTGGYRALAATVERGAEWVLRELEASGLLGRGGAAFPAGRKWRAVAGAAGRRRVVCNADESEPGTFKDRVLMEEDPHAVVEAMTIAGLTVGAEDGLIYIRGEYPRAADRLGAAIAEAQRANLLGADVAGSGRPFRIRIFRGAGAYICGEETSLFNSVEGRRGEPRNKPPFPTQVGLFGDPTLVNNVETLCNVPLIVLEGAADFRRCGTDRSTGTKLFCVTGHVERPGVYEVPFGTPLSELLSIAGGVWRGRKLKAVLCGGAAGTFLGPDRLDLPLTIEDLAAAGGTLGSGAVIVLDETAPLWETVLRIARFFQEESCGQCVPCRVGTQRQLEIVERRVAGRARKGDAALLREIGAAMTDASICGLGQTAAGAILSALALDGEGSA